MTTSANSMVSDQLADCIASGRSPTISELFSQAECIWIDGAAGRSAFAWSRLEPDSRARISALKNAHIALTGNPLP